MSLRIVTAPEGEIITLPEAKRHCRLAEDDSAEDSLVQLLIDTAVDTAAERTRRSLLTRTYELRVPVACTIPLPRPPFIGLVSVKLEDEDGGETVLSQEADDYALDDTLLVPELTLRNLDGKFAVVRFTAGYGTAAADIPAPLRRWMLVAINTMYEHRENCVVGASVSDVPRTFIDGLLDAYVVPVV